MAGYKILLVLLTIFACQSFAQPKTNLSPVLQAQKVKPQPHQIETVKNQLSEKEKIKKILDMKARATSKGGGVIHGGGGNSIEEKKASPKQIMILISKSKEPLYKILRSIQTSGFGTNPLDRFTYMKMFLDDPDFPQYHKVPDDLKSLISNYPIYERIMKAQFIFVKSPEAFCYDKEGQPKDAAVIDESQNTICFDMTRLSKSVLADRLFDQVLSLVLHEISHLVKTTEPEAERLQSYSFNARAGDFDKNFWNDYQRLTSSIDYLDWDIRDIQVDSSPLDTEAQRADVCYKINELQKNIMARTMQIERIMQKYEGVLLKNEGLQLVSAAFSKAVLLKLFCLPEDSQQKSLIRSFDFKNQTSADLETFFSPGTNNSIGLISLYNQKPKGTVKYIEYLNKSQFQDEARDIADLLTKAKTFVVHEFFNQKD